MEAIYSACTIATSLLHSRIDYCNSLLHAIPATQSNRLQLVLNSAARAVTKTLTFHHISPILRYVHWLKIHERIKYKVLYHAYKSLINLLAYALFFHPVTSLQLHLLPLSPLVALLSPFVLKLQTYLYKFYSCFVEQSPIWSTSRHSFTGDSVARSRNLVLGSLVTSDDRALWIWVCLSV